MKNFILREEYFGSSTIRRKGLTFNFLENWQTTFLKKAETKPISIALIETQNEYKNTKDMKNNDISLEKITSFFNEKKSEGMFTLDNKINYEFRITEENKNNLPKGILKSPLRIYFEITRKCNLHCKNCFSSSGKAYKDELTEIEVFKILDNLRKEDVFEIRTTGGEPTQRVGWENIIKHAKDLELLTSLNTNGIYKDFSTRDKILNLDIDQVIISLDGNKESHEHLRGKGSYNKTLETIQYLSKHANNIRINTILKEESLPHINDLVELASNNNSEVCFILLRPVGRGEDLVGVIPSVKKLYDAVINIRELRKQYPNTKIMTSYDVISANAIKPAPDLDLSGCAAGLRGIGISSRGEIQFCGFLSEITKKYSPGNIRDNNYSTNQIWRESDKIKEFRERNLKQNILCTTCKEYGKKDFGTCVVMSIAKENNSSHTDPYCAKDEKPMISKTANCTTTCHTQNID